MLKDWRWNNVLWTVILQPRVDKQCRQLQRLIVHGPQLNVTITFKWKFFMPSVSTVCRKKCTCSSNENCTYNYIPKTLKWLHLVDRIRPYMLLNIFNNLIAIEPAILFNIIKYLATCTLFSNTESLLQNLSVVRVLLNSTRLELSMISVTLHNVTDSTSTRRVQETISASGHEIFHKMCPKLSCSFHANLPLMQFLLFMIFKTILTISLFVFCFFIRYFLQFLA